MSPFVELQKVIISWLLRVVDTADGPDFLRELIGFPDINQGWMSDRLRNELARRHLHFPSGPEDESAGYPTEQALKIFQEQIDVSDPEKVVIRNLLGLPFGPSYSKPYGIDDLLKKRGSGDNFLRTDFCAQPCALQVGDTLITGEIVVKEPREGGNGQVLVCLSDGDDRVVWLGFPSRTALALASQDKKDT